MDETTATTANQDDFEDPKAEHEADQILRSVRIRSVGRLSDEDLAAKNWSQVKNLPLDTRSVWLKLEAVRQRLTDAKLHEYKDVIARRRESIRRRTCSSAVAELIFRNGGNVPHGEACDCYECRERRRVWPGYYMERSCSRSTRRRVQLSFECYLEGMAGRAGQWPSSPGSVVRSEDILDEDEINEYAQIDLTNLVRMRRPSSGTKSRFRSSRCHVMYAR